MPKSEVSLSDHVVSELERLVEQGEFLNREEAVEELLSRGISAYDTSEESPRDMQEEMFTQTVEDQQDPASRTDEPSDEYTL